MHGHHMKLRNTTRPKIRSLQKLFGLTSSISSSQLKICHQGLRALSQHLQLYTYVHCWDTTLPVQLHLQKQNFSGPQDVFYGTRMVVV